MYKPLKGNGLFLSNAIDYIYIYKEQTQNVDQKLRIYVG